MVEQQLSTPYAARYEGESPVTQVPLPQQPQILTKHELQAAADRVLDSLGLTAAQLQDQARTGRFSSERARFAWATIRDFVTPR